MSRPKLPKTEIKIQLSVTISQETSEKLGKATTNKSKFIEELLKKHLK